MLAGVAVRDVVTAHDAARRIVGEDRASLIRGKIYQRKIG
jgi:hypothetical protein